MCPVLLKLDALPTFARKEQGHGLGYCMTAADASTEGGIGAGRACEDGMGCVWDGCVGVMGVMCLVRCDQDGRPCWRR